jgi:hypothetical protein
LAKFTHGQSATPEYKVWKGIIKRCENKNSIDYPEYGGRGITISEKWRNDFPVFLTHIGPRPSTRSAALGGAAEGRCPMRNHKHPTFIPPWQDAPTLCAHICISEGTLDNWVRLGVLPPPKPVGGKRMWKWTEVERYLENVDGVVPSSPSAEAQRIINATREAATRRDS